MGQQKPIYLREYIGQLSRHFGYKLLLVPVVGVAIFLLSYQFQYKPSKAYYKSGIVLYSPQMDAQLLSSYINKSKGGLLFESDKTKPWKQYVKNVLAVHSDTNDAYLSVHFQVYEYPVLDSIKPVLMRTLATYVNEEQNTVGATIEMYRDFHYDHIQYGKSILPSILYALIGLCVSLGLFVLIFARQNGNRSQSSAEE